MSTWKYLPILKWKRGEQDALRYLSPSHWKKTVPLLEIQPDAELTLDELRDEVSAQIEKSVPSGRQVFIDTIYARESHQNQLELASWFAYTLQKKLPDRKISPVVQAALAGSFSTATAKMRQRFQSMGELMLRFRTDLSTPTELDAAFSEVGELGVSDASTHVLVDQFSLVGSDPTLAKAALDPFLAVASALQCPSVTLGGGSFPINLVSFKAGTHDIPRIEWKLWQLLKAAGDVGGLRYADYAVTHPSRLAEIDPKQVNPSISIRYAAPDFWRLYKGSGFKGGAPGTLRGLCKLLTTDSVYSGAGFSYGDNNYETLAKSTKQTNGIPWTWRRDATNHHLAQTVGSL